MIEIEDKIVEGITIDKENTEFNLALEYALQTNESIFLTGKAGSGKTTFLKYLREVTPKSMIVLAPTGVAAINAGGQTIHSFFQIEPSVYFPGDHRLMPSNGKKPGIKELFKYSSVKVNIIRELQMLVIDEVSMVRCDLLDVIDALLRSYRNSALPFGGVQLLLIGDVFQLPPVVVDEERDILGQFYESEFFFSSSALKKINLTYIELKKIYRQNDRAFVDLLNRVRINRMLPSDFSLFHSKVNPQFKPENGDNYIVLATTNSKVNQVNTDRLAELETESAVYEAFVEGEFSQKSMPTEQSLELKVGAQVMFVKNDRDKRYYNGKIGVVTNLDEDLISVEIENRFGEKIEVDVEREEWCNIKYTWNRKDRKIEQEVVGVFTQFPLRLAWAITIHKSQGLTFERVVADLGNSFSPGQVYVALSRCVSFDGVVLSSEITPRSIFTDQRVVEFARTELPSSALHRHLVQSKADYYYEMSRDALRRKHPAECLDYFLKARLLRNDVETKQFRRYFLVNLTRLINSAKMAGKLEKENVSLRLENAALKAENDLLSKKCRKLSKAVSPKVRNQISDDTKTRRKIRRDQ